MSDQPPITLEMINNNFVSIMSMVIGINCRLNMLETLLNEIKEKMPGADLEEDEESVGSGAPNEQESVVMDALDYSAKVICSMVTENQVLKEEKMDEKKETTETDDREITCDDCKAVFLRGKGGFTRHLLTTRCRPYGCSICKKLFKKKSNMQTHKLTHSTDNLECFKCGAMFRCEQYLRNHQKRVHKEDSTATADDEDEPASKRTKLDSTSSSSATETKVFDRADFEAFLFENIGENLQ